ncbi:Exoglucanase B [Thermoflexales bacterium]|nr:Exoglucanase B [Thermoflexales bacterium]
MQRLLRILLFVSLIVTSCSLAVGGPVQATPSNPYLYPYNQPTSVTFNVNDVTQAWTSWKGALVTANNAGGGGRLRVMGGVDSSSTVSEGQGYGILFASIFDDQTTLDGLWLFTRDYLDAQGLMDWHIGSPGQVIGSGAATDGDEDMALGMVNACVKVRKGAWSASPHGLDYCAIATNLINAIYTHEIDKPGSQPLAGLPNNAGDELLPGDMWNLARDYPEGIVNLSYFAPGYYTVFGKFTNNLSVWQAVNARNYAITNLAQGKAGNCSKLVPNWNQYDGDVQVVSWQPQNSGWWSWDAARFAWRVAVDEAWYNTAEAQATMNEVGGFFSSVGINNVQAQYRLDGTSVDGYTGVFFVANAAAAIWAAPSPSAVNCGAATGTLKSTPQQAYDRVVSFTSSSTDYYNGSWRLLALLLMTGNFPNFWELSQGGDTQAPTTPTNLASPSQTSSSINLTWTASTDNVGVTGYDIYRGTTLAGSSTTASFNDTGLTADTLYSYTVRAKDAAGNVSAASAALSVRTSTSTDTQAPTVPTSLASPSQTTTSVNLSWTASTDNVGVTGYDIYRGTALAGSSTTTSFSDTGLTPDTLYSYTVRAKDAAGNVSAASAALSVRTKASGGGSCAVDYTIANQWNNGFQANIKITNNAAAAIQGWTLTWAYANGQQVTSAWNSTCSQIGSTVTCSVPANHWNGTIGANGGSVSFGFQGTHTGVNTNPTVFVLNGVTCGEEGPDTQAPTVPTNLASSSQTTTSINLTWTASTDNVGVTGYDIYRGTTLVGSSTTTSFVDSGLTPDTLYSYTVRAKDAAGHVSAASAALSVRTRTDVDTQAPSVPTNLASPSQTTTSINLTWTASTDNVGVTGYDIYRGTTLAGSSATTSFVDSSLTPDTLYSYTVRAKDAAGNVSAASAALSVRTRTDVDTQAPSVPTNLASPSQTTTSINLTWTASTDNVGVTGYDIYRGTTLAGSSTTTSFSDTGLTADTLYSYTVRAKDAAGNVSAASTALSVRTKAASGGCAIKYTVNQWNTGFTADVKITNNSTAAVSGWTLTWSFANGQQITSSWNATVSQSGANVTASNPASHWNGTIGANGGSVSFGIQGTHSGTNATPTNFTLNGQACTVTP